MKTSFYSKPLILSMFICTLVNVGVFLINSDLLYPALVWNLFLAFVPGLFLILYQKQDYLFGKLVFGGLWLLFLPNTFYMLTDLMHIQLLSLEKVSSSPYGVNIFLRDFQGYLGFVAIIAISLLGAYLGLKNVNWMKEACPYQDGFNMVISFLVAIAIYIGRFLRLNSWNVIRPLTLLKTVIVSLDGFALGFIVLVTLSLFALNKAYQIIVS